MTMKPALTAEEWVKSLDYIRINPNSARFITTDWDGATYYDAPEDRHASAALALYGQPFGFTREDVELLRKLIARVDWTRINDAEIERAHTIADRIEALLPPEG